jgi:hypothetical protein
LHPRRRPIAYFLHLVSHRRGSEIPQIVWFMPQIGNSSI